MKPLILLAILAAAWAGAVRAEGAPLGDPTRPPAEFAGPEGAEPAEAGLRLQSVLLPKNGKPTAIISGKLVALGGKVGEARLVRLSETEAVLAGPQGIERLALTPDARKIIRKDREPTGAAGKAGEKRERP